MSHAARITRLLLAGLVAVTGLFVVAPPASATPGCVTEFELFSAKRSMTKSQVHDIFDTSGRVFDTWVGPEGYDEVRTYRKCPGFDGGRSRVVVWYDTYSYAFNGRISVFRKWRWIEQSPFTLFWDF